MRNRWAFPKWFLTVAHHDEIMVRRGRAVLLAAYGLIVICIVAVPVLVFTRGPAAGYVNVAVALVVYVGVIAATRRGHVLAAAVVFNVMNAIGPAVGMLGSTSAGAPFYLVFLPLLAAATMPPAAVVAVSVGMAPLLVARLIIFSDQPAMQREVASAVLILMLTAVVAFVLSLTSESSIRRLKRALAELSNLNETLEERVRARTADLAAAEQRRRDTMKGVGHDMGNMLMVMSGSAAFAAEALERGDTADARELLDRFETTTMRLSRVAADLMDSALAETGQLNLHPTPLDLASATRTVLAELEDVIARQALSIQITGATAPPAFADSDRLKRVLHNIIGNAIKFTPPGGRIEIATAAEKGAAVWTCHDNGCGIAPERLHQLGQELLRFDPATSQGMGLGLYTSTHIVRASGGRISYSSGGIGAGTMVRVCLPLAPTETRRDSGDAVCAVDS